MREDESNQRNCCRLLVQISATNYLLTASILLAIAARMKQTAAANRAYFIGIRPNPKAIEKMTPSDIKTMAIVFALASIRLLPSTGQIGLLADSLRVL